MLEILFMIKYVYDFLINWVLILKIYLAFEHDPAVRHVFRGKS